MRLETLESHSAEIVSDNPNMMIAHYIMAAYAYYVQDDPIFSDAYYDELCKSILLMWDHIDHRHKSYLDKDALRAGSYLGEYPVIIEGALDEFRAIYSRNRPRKRK
jgi:hypothetical protein